MKLWLISQDENEGYDTFDAAVVAAETEEQAKSTHPYGSEGWSSGLSDTWASSPEKVTAKYLGEAYGDIKKPEVILGSFNAG